MALTLNQKKVLKQMVNSPEYINTINAFRAGYRHGLATGLPASPKEAISAIEALHEHIDSNSSAVEAFCNGSEDGAKKDSFRYRATYLPETP